MTIELALGFFGGLAFVGFVTALCICKASQWADDHTNRPGREE